MNKEDYNSRRLDVLYPDVAAEWNYEKNNGLRPSDVTYGSAKKVWWRCEKGHEWETQVRTRTRGKGCPYCSGRAPANEKLSLAALYPDIAAQWLQDKNGFLKPDEVRPSSRNKVWWRCEKGHEWMTSVDNRVYNGCGCLVCAGKRVQKGFNDLATVNPILAREWNTEKNNGLTAEEVHPGSNKSYWWKCALGHEWKATPSSRTIGGNCCPYCANRLVAPGFNDLATLYPKIAAQWHPTLNGTLTPDAVVAGSTKYAWWLCPDGHVWKTKVCKRTYKNTGCPVCAGNVKKTDRYKFVDEKFLEGKDT